MAFIDFDKDRRTIAAWPRWAKWTIGTCAVLVVGISLLPEPPPTPPQATERARAAQADLTKEKAHAAGVAEEHRKGFHCLSAWDGSSRPVVAALKEELRDPDSLDIIETRIWPEYEGHHVVLTRFRARNGFGGMNIAKVRAVVDHDTCDLVELDDPVES